MILECRANFDPEYYFGICSLYFVGSTECPKNLSLRGDFRKKADDLKILSKLVLTPPPPT